MIPFHKIQDISACADMLASLYEQHGPIPDEIWGDVVRAFKKARYGIRLRFLAELEQKCPELVGRLVYHD